MKEIIPTAMREFYVEVSRVKWEDVGDFTMLRGRFMTTYRSIKEPESFSRMGVKTPRGAYYLVPQL